MEVLGSIYIVLTLVALLIAVLWILMPFAVFGIKDLARELIAEKRKTNKLLEQLIAQGTQTK